MDNRYLTYNDYKTMKGTISEMPFDRLELKAEKEVDKYTQGRFKDVNEYPKELKMCIYDLISILNEDNNSVIVSESVGDYSVTKKTKEQINHELKETIMTWLSEVKVNNINVLYCGADICKRK